MQDRGGWYKPAGKGHIFYFIAGHSARDLENPAYQQIILNALNWKPGMK
jgi:type 1 glutamine amidotransferase